MALGLSGLFFAPCQAIANEPESEALRWARVDFLRNRVQLLPAADDARRARISDILQIGDSLRTMRRSRAELRFNDSSLARIGERATFRFTPNTRNFQLTNGTVLLLIPPGRGRSTIQTPNAVTGIQGSALFVRYIPETDTTIVGALTDNPDGPMVLFNRDGSEQQALQANEIGVIEGDQITELYRFDSELFWESSGLAEGFNYEQDASPTGDDALDGVRQEIREAVSKQTPLPSDGAGVIENPSSFSRPDTENASSGTDVSAETAESSATSESTDSNTDDSSAAAGSETQESAEGSSTGEASDRSDNEAEDTTGSQRADDTSPGASLTGTPSQTDSTNDAPDEETTIDVLEPVPGAAPVEEVIEDTVLEEELAEVEEPVVELEFEGTPAEAYLSAPLIASPAQPTNGGSKLVPTEPIQPPEEAPEDSDGTGTEPLPEPDKVSVPVDTVPTSVDDALDNSPINGRDPVEGVPGGRPLTGGDQKDPDVTEDPVAEDDPEIQPPGSPAPTIEVIDNPPAADPPEPGSIDTTDSPTEPPTEPATPPIEATPILPEAGDNLEEPLLLNPDVTPETAVPATPPSGPALDPSTDLIPVEIEDAGGGNPPAELVQPEVPTDLTPQEEIAAPEPSDPAQSPEPVIETGPEDISSPPEPTIEPVTQPEVIEPVQPAPAPPIIENLDSDIPFDEPEVGGVSVEETLDPANLPEQIENTVPDQPRNLTDSSNNPVIDPAIDDTVIPPNEPVEERILL